MQRSEILKIRTASLDDLLIVSSLGRETYRDHFSWLWSEKAVESFLQYDFSEKSLHHSLSSVEHTWLLAEDSNDMVLGYAKINWDRPDPISSFMGAELQKIYFRSCATGKGYGKKLLEFIVNEAIRHGQDSIWLDVLKSNSEAQRFYAKFDFKEIGEIPFSSDLFELGMVVMSRKLTTASQSHP